MVNIDTVYQRVLVLANKEQRGYITPQEFNLFANQAQMDIFEQYFYDLNQFLRIPGNDTEYADMVNILEEKINIFEAIFPGTPDSNGMINTSAIIGMYRLGSIQFRGVEVEKVEHKDFEKINRAPLTTPTISRPIFQARGDSVIIRPIGLDIVNIHYIRRPADVVWGYEVINEKAIHNATRSTDFQLHASEETDLVIKILQLAGITMDDQALYQIASQEDIKSIQQEKK